jgi:demethylmenaquinone methyltransferase/2-methoxy-6-polyprenyl-1,4-benzoquinol methylase
MTAHHFERIALCYDLMNTSISFGLHKRWKNSFVGAVLKSCHAPVVVLDVATGTGDVACLLEKKLNNQGHVIGIDPSLNMLDLAKKKSKKIQWVMGSSESLPFPDQSVDLITCTFGVRNFDNRKVAFSEWKRILKPGAIGGILEIHPTHSKFAFLSRLYWNYFMPFLGKIIFQKEAYEYLRSSSNSFLTPDELKLELSLCGFVVIESKPIFYGGMVNQILFEKPR